VNPTLPNPNGVANPSDSPSQHRGLFLGLLTLDLIYQLPQLPQSNQKLTAANYSLAAGGPATNAAVAFSTLGHSATVVTVLGQHPITALVHQDLAPWCVAIADLMPQHPDPPPISSILVTEPRGDRAVVSINATRIQGKPDQIPPSVWQDLHQGHIEVVLIDGHQMAVGIALAQAARAQNIPVVLDGGSWKPGCEKLLPWVDYAICSANFQPPGCDSEAAVLDYLQDYKIAHIAITYGERPITYRWGGADLGSGTGEGTIVGTIPVPQIKPVDTLGAGDIFHGAFCHWILDQDFPTALAQAAKVAAYSCQFFGTRQGLLS
jgi:sugar/nucleoside kinase (ribokinase family)